MIKYPLILLTFSLIFLHNLGISLFPEHQENYNKTLNTNLFSVENYSSLRDTVYTAHNYYVEVNLTTQTGWLHSREGIISEFGVSSGNDKLRDGVNTNEGLFVIQAMLPSWNSEQFDSTLLINWMGFNHGIGFHSMLGSRYYKYLGKKNLSHGCIRLSRKDAWFIYSRIEKGTPVLVHSGNNAINISFADTINNSYKIYSYKDLKRNINNRIKRIYEGIYFLETQPKLLIDLANVKHDGLPIGDSKKISAQQLTYPKNNFFVSFVEDNLINKIIIKNSLK